MKKKYYITTPIYYVNDIPHIGHSCTTVVADALARYHRKLGFEVFFLTGTDEHGAKVAQSAEKQGLTPQEFADKVSKRFKNAWKELNISNDYFIRTTSNKHKKIVQQIIEKIYKSGDIYKGRYEGLYCIGCEKFLTEKELENGKCPLHPGQKVESQIEENYFFRLSKYVPDLIKRIKNDETNYIFPQNKRKEILSKLTEGVEDVSISREKIKWGVEFPKDKKHTVYVWVDALINYYSATRFVENKQDFWPADLHLIGKEILWFHTVIWPAMLLSAELPLPKKVYAHSFYTVDGQKMSKSLGNVISPKELIDKYGTDASRYLIASSFPQANDSDIGWDKFNEKYNADLANGLGNLVSRVAKLAQKEKLNVKGVKTGFDSSYNKLIKNLNITECLFEVWNNPQWGVQAANKKFNEEKIWEKKGQDLNNSLEEIIKMILKICYHLYPFMPQTAEKIQWIFSPEKIVKFPSKPLFPRIKSYD